MMPWIYHALYHGVRGALIAAATGITALGHWPTKWEWLIVSCGGVIGFFNGCDSYRQEPK